MLNAENITIGYGARTVLDGVTLSLCPGEVLAVLGPNGAGKSTLLRALSGERRPVSGQVTLEGTDLARIPRDAIARRRGVLAQETLLTFPFRVEEVVQLGRSPHAGRSTADQDARVIAAALHAVSAEHLAGRVYTTLSGGERQRVNLARVLAQVWSDGTDGAARYLLLDEPIASLDPAHQHATMGTARRFAENGGAVLAVLHELNIAAMYADRICLMRAGAIVALEPPARALTRDRVREVFDLDVHVIAHPARDCLQVVPA